VLSVVVVRVHPLSMEQHVPVIFLDLSGTSCTPVMFSIRSILHWLTKCLCHLLVILQPLFIKDDMQRFFMKLMQKSFLAAYCNINLSV